MMIVLGITGGIGSGKTTVANLFKDWGIPIFIADKQAKILMNTSPMLREQITAYFGEEAYQDQKLNSAYLAEQVFENPKALQKLNGFVHPAVAEEFELWKSNQKSPLVVYEAAILFENNRQDTCDYTLLVVASKEEKIKRIQQRDKISKAQIEARMANQWSDERKMKLADFVLNNEDLIKTRKNVQKIYKYLKKTHNF